MVLETIDYINGIFSIIFVVISLILGLLIFVKYFQNKNINFIYISLTWIFISCGWWGTSLSFLWTFFEEDGLTLEAILLLNFMPLPLGLFSWLTAYTNFLYKEKQKMVLLLVLIITVVFYASFISYIIIDPNLIAVKISPVDTSAKFSFLIIYLLFFIFLMLVTGIHFAIKTIKVEDRETKLKGKLLLFAFPTFIIAALLDSLIPTNALTLIIFRTLLIISALLFYWGFILPKYFKKIFNLD